WFALALIDDRYRRAADDVFFVRRGVRHPKAGRRAVLLPKRQRIVGLQTLELIARRLQVQLDFRGFHVAVRACHVHVAGVGQTPVGVAVFHLLRGGRGRDALALLVRTALATGRLNPGLGGAFQDARGGDTARRGQIARLVVDH